ncbi:hypothetical protein FTO60_09990 [Octadecabacter sp. SW4]|uniref:hypothetical protein n=1 Tax=Octadecabacter sp. SW4 TaxID=2602067 RepID=UPI0011C2095E|nr:hypothetical protein [Octadecabacter sp. SW4]QEE36012.1 hypothetical protein FTO60_09990 [Octadecabacter sp. SW4]
MAQLLEDLAKNSSSEFVWITDPDREIELVDRIIVLNQDYTLAHFKTIQSHAKPTEVFLRRSTTVNDTLQWEMGLSWFSGLLADEVGSFLTLTALSQESADQAKAHLSREVGVISPFTPVTPGRFRAVLSRREDLIEVVGEDEASRRATLSLFNWARLRRLGVLATNDDDDLDLCDLVAAATATTDDAPPTPVSDRRPTLLAVVPNGVGLGHITRMMAIAFALREQYGTRVVFWCFSRAAEIVQAAGFEVILRQTSSHLGAHPPDWREFEKLEFAKAIRHLRPNAVSYDGMTFDPFIVAALKEPGCGNVGMIWVRRGMLQPDADAQLLESEQFCDIVLEPGDLSVENDKGPTRLRQAQHRGFSERLSARPVTLKPYLPAYDKKVARKKLGLPRRANCLVSLGGAFGNWDRIRTLINNYAQVHRVNLVWAQSPLAAAPNQDMGKTMIRRFYPLSRYLAAFDGMVTATGYNSYHELMLGFSRPVLLAPTNHERLDDQVARASHAADAGWVSMLHPDRPEQFEAIIDDFLAKVRKRTVISGRPPAENGGPDAARAIHEVCERYQ